MLRRAFPPLALVLLSLALITAVPAATTPTGLLQLPGATGCIYDPEGGSERGVHEDLIGFCAEASGLDGAYAVAASWNGRYLYVGSFSGDSLSIFLRDAKTGSVEQLSGFDGCLIDADVDRRCTAAFALDGVSDLALSPDGRHLYVAAWFSHTVGLFERDRATGRLTQAYGEGTCVGPGVVHEECGGGAAMYAPSGVAISPDGRHVYVAAPGSDAVAAFARDVTSGALRQLPGSAACVRELPEDWPEGEPDPAGCAPGVGLLLVSALAVSRDGKYVYVSSFGGSTLSVFARDRATGALRQLAGSGGCVSEDGSGGRCADGRGLQGAFSVELSPDGRNVYVASGFDIRRDMEAFASSGVAVFARDVATGRVRQLAGRAGCISETGSRGACADGVALEGAEAVAVSPDGKNVYVAATASDAVAVLAREPRTGGLRQLAGRAGCVSETGTGGACRDGVGLWGVSSLQLSPDGRFVYAPGFYASALAVFARPTPPAPKKR